MNADGSMLLKDLMRCWGLKQGLDESAILATVRAYMFHEGDVSKGSRRFAVYEGCPAAGVSIKVLPSRYGQSVGGSPFWSLPERQF